MDNLSYIKNRVRIFSLFCKSIKITITIFLSLSLSLFLYLVFDYIFLLTSPIRMISLIIIISIPLILCLKIAIAPSNAVSQIEKEYPEFKGRLLASISKYPNQLGYSRNLINSITKQSANIIKSTDFRPAVKKNVHPFLKFLPVVLAFPLLFFIISPERSYISMKRLFLPKIPFFSLEISPKEENVVYGDKVQIKIIPKGIMPRKIYFFKNDVAEVLRPPFIWKPKGFRYIHTVTLSDLKEDITCYAKVGDVRTEDCKIRILIKPYIESLSLTYNYPAYTRFPSLTTSVRTINALYGTRIKIKGKANIELQEVKCELKDHPVLASVKDNEFELAFRVAKEDSYRFTLLGENGLSSISQFYPIKVFEDDTSRVEIIAPAMDMPIPDNMYLPILFHCFDDYGITKGFLVIKDRQIPVFVRAIHELPLHDTILLYNWDLTSLGLLPGDVCEYHIEVLDNDIYKGPKIGKSRTYKVFFPTMEQIYEEVKTQEQVMEKGLEDVVERLKKAGERLENIMKNMETGKETVASFEQIKGIQEEMESYKDIKKELQELARQLDNTIAKMENTLFIDRELMEKIEQVRRLFSEIETEEMREALKKLEDAIDKHPEKLASALKNFKLSEEELRKRIERTLALLERFKKEEDLRKLVDKALEIKEKQAEINKGEPTTEQLAKQQESLEKELQQLKTGMEELGKQVHLAEEESLKQGLKEETERAEGIMEKMGKLQSRYNRDKKASSLQKQTLSELSQLHSNLSSMYEDFVKQGKMSIISDIRKVETELNLLSFEQEGIDVASDLRIGREVESAYMQENIREGAKNVKDKVSSLMKLSPFISGRALAYIDGALKEMENTKENLLSGSRPDKSRAIKTRDKAMEFLNLATLELMKSENAIMQASSCTGMGEMMQQLQSITKEQMSINQFAMSLLPMNLGQGDLGKQLAEIAARQEALAQKLGQLAEGLKGKTLGDMGRVSEEMKNLSEEMRKRINEDIIKRQNEILRHLLDAQKSIHTKKFSKKRISEPGENVYQRSPEQLKLRTRRGISQRDILNALKKDYPQEYEQIIRAYFRALATE